VGTYARRRRSCPTWRPYSKRDTQPWFTVYFLDIGHPCYDQLTPVKTRYLLTNITWPYRRLKFTTHGSHMFLGSWLLTRCWFSDWITGSCQVNLFTTWQDCSEAGLRIKSWPNYNFFFNTNFFLLLCFLYMMIIKTRNRRQKKKLTTKLPNSNENSTFSWVSGSEQPGQGASLLG